MLQKPTPILTTYEYDKYDIIDFMEPEYIDDWLSTIPKDIWNKYKSSIATQLCKLKDEKIIKYILEKIKLNLPKHIVQNFDKISLELLKYCVKTDFSKLKDEIKKYSSTYDKIIKECFLDHDYEFNKYFYENIYFELEPTHKNTPPKISNLFGLIDKKNDFNEDNMFYKKITSVYDAKYGYKYITDIEILKYYNSKFNGVFAKIKKNNVKNIIQYIIGGNKNGNFDYLIEIQNIFGMNILEFTSALFYCANSVNSIATICRNYDMDSILKVLNLCDDKILLIKENIVNIMASLSIRNDDISKNIANVFLIHNYFEYQKNFKFTEQIYSSIIEKIIQRGGKKHYEYSEIIFEFINLGGKISRCSMYTDYIDRIKIKPNQNNLN